MSNFWAKIKNNSTKIFKKLKISKYFATPCMYYMYHLYLITHVTCVFEDTCILNSKCVLYVWWHTCTLNGTRARSCVNFYLYYYFFCYTLMRLQSKTQHNATQIFKFVFLYLILALQFKKNIIIIFNFKVII